MDQVLVFGQRGELLVGERCRGETDGAMEKRDALVTLGEQMRGGEISAAYIIDSH